MTSTSLLDLEAKAHPPPFSLIRSIGHPQLISIKSTYKIFQNTLNKSFTLIKRYGEIAMTSQKMKKCAPTCPFSAIICAARDIESG